MILLKGIALILRVLEIILLLTLVITVVIVGFIPAWIIKLFSETRKLIEHIIENSKRKKQGA